MENETIYYTIEYELETDGRWLAEVVGIPGVLAYGHSVEEAISRVEALGLLVIADRLEHGETSPGLLNISFAATAA